MVGFRLEKAVHIDPVVRRWFIGPYITSLFISVTWKYRTYVQEGPLTASQLLGGFLLQGVLLLSPLTLALAYTYAQENPNRQLTYFIVTFSAKWLPYAMLAMTFVMGSPSEALLQGTGLIAAHAYDFITKIWPEHGGGRRYLTTPQLVRQWFAKAGGTPQARTAGTAFAASPAGAQNVPQQPAGSGGGWASGFSGGNWGGRGQGIRLGGE